MQNGNQGTFMSHNEGISWDRCRHYKGMREPSNADCDRVNAVKSRANGGPIFYKDGLAVSTED